MHTLVDSMVPIASKEQAEGAPPDARLRQVLEHAAHLLPAQGPINVFVHHNTLHAFEDLSFDEGVQKGSRLFGCEPYLSEERYRQQFERGRIGLSDLEAVLRQDLGSAADEPVASVGTRFELRLAMLEFPLRFAPAAELRWFVAQTDALAKFRPEASASMRERFLEETRHWVMRDLRNGNGSAANQGKLRDRRSQVAFTDLLSHFNTARIETWSQSTWEKFSLQALWRTCRRGVHGVKGDAAPRHTELRPRDLLLQATGVDSDQLVHEVLIRFCAAFLDQGIADWTLPERERGFLHAFEKLYETGGASSEPWRAHLPHELARWQQEGLSPSDTIIESLTILGVPEPEWESFVTSTLLALRGWAGMIWQMETRADRVAHPIPSNSLIEFLAVRLLLDRLALTHVAQQSLRYRGPLAELRQATRAAIPKQEVTSVDGRAFLVFQLAQVRGWTPALLGRLTKRDWSALVEEIEAFSGWDRRRVFQAAFERRYRIQTLDAMHVRSQQASAPPPEPQFQLICCIDEREESLRRHIEELSSQTETFSIAGFFGVAMYYQGVGDANFVPLCPIVIRPQHWVKESVPLSFDEAHRRRSRVRRALGLISHQCHIGSRSFAGGAIMAAALGGLASVPLLARVLLPRFTSRVRRTASWLVRPPTATQLTLERSDPKPSLAEGHIGFTLDEMIGVAERALRDIGLITNFAPLVVILGHGSNSLNNPHKSAYDCGACGGNAGGANARALAQMLNDPRVRTALVQRGLNIPAETAFVGALHNTCNDSITYFDLDRLPTSHLVKFEDFEQLLHQACDRNAHERCRRFQSAPLSMSFSAARRHVEGRAEDLAQTRPECGHATNAICVVGRRQRTRQLYLDRRAFLTSYDPTQDDAENTILARIMAAVVPVCAGINLEYYFSYVDPSGWGCGTKLPHNVTSLLGIMDGAASDLRPGLPWQMVEIHEPVRLLFIVETTPAAMLGIMQRNQGIGKLCRNGWVQMATLDPHSPAMHVFQDGKFVPYTPETSELPIVPSSASWYRGWRDHLGFALIHDPDGTHSKR
jgi:uncharacterized protein YbcC (UPF0753/DUF2309 family)